MSNDLMQIERLKRLAQEIGVEEMKAAMANHDKGKHGYNQVVDKIKGWVDVVTLAEKQLKTRSHFNNMMHDQNRFGAGAHSAKQRHASHAGNIQKVDDALKLVINALVKLINTLDGNSDNEETRALKAMSHALGNWLKMAKNTEVGIYTGAPQAVQATITQAQPWMPPGPAQVPGFGTINGFTLVLAICILLKREFQRRG